MAERKVPLGKPLDLSEEERDAMAFNITPEMIEHARQQVARDDAEAGRFANAPEQDPE